MTIPHFRNCDDHWYCESQEHIREQQTTQRSSDLYSISVSSGMTTAESSTTTVPPDEKF